MKKVLLLLAFVVATIDPGFSNCDTFIDDGKTFCVVSEVEAFSDGSCGTECGNCVVATCI